MVSKLPVTSLILGDCFTSLLAEADCASRVRATMLKGALAFNIELISDPPCLPVAPVIRRARDVIVLDGEEVVVERLVRKAVVMDGLIVSF